MKEHGTAVRVINRPLQGMVDSFGQELRQREYVERALADVARGWGYERVEVPLIERAAAFGEDIVGASPWPEWDGRSSFSLTVADYGDSYASPRGQADGLLIPEGTIPVCRWLGGRIDDDPGLVLPLKVFYLLPCFRNEVLAALSPTKRRSFYQFGAEIFGAAHAAADLEIAHLMGRLLADLGVPTGDLVLRLSDVRIFNRLIEHCGIGPADTITLKEALDALAECRAGKSPERRADKERELRHTLDGYALSPGWSACWEFMLRDDTGGLAAEARSTFPPAYADLFAELERLIAAVRSCGLRAELDLCVVRSHEYYTSRTFELDVVTGAQRFFEVAAGGRYDGLVSHFAGGDPPPSVPGVGFAFGVERVAEVLTALHLFEGGSRPARPVSLDASTADVLLLMPPAASPLDGYREALAAAADLGPASPRHDIYLGDDRGEAAVSRYQRERQIPRRLDL